MKVKIAYFLYLSLIVLFCQKSALAENEFMDLELSMDEDMFMFEDIPSVYSASKYEQKVIKAPASISIVTADEIKKYGYRTFSEVLSSLRGFYSTNDRNYGYTGVRGFGLPSDYNTRLLLLIDGHRFNDNIYDSFDTLGSFPLDLDTIERVEVVRGPSSSLYGTSAFFGVINVITKRGRDLGGVNVSASYGSYDAYKTRISYGDRFNSGLEVFLSGTFYDTQGDESLYYKEFDDPATNNGNYNNNDEEQTRQLMGTLSYQDFTLRSLYTDNKKDVPTGAYETVFNDPGSHTYDQQIFVNLTYDHTFDNHLNLQSKISYNKYRYTGGYPYDYSENDTPDIVINKDQSDGQWWRAEIQATKVMWDEHRITVGGDYQDNFQQYQTNYDLERYVESDQDTYKWAIFIQDEYNITQKWTLNAGVRLDYFSTFGETINPRVALIYNPWESTAIKLLYGSAFRAPNEYELNYHDDGSTTLASEALQPEELETLELIVEHYFNKNIRAEVNFFRTEISDILSLVSLPDGLLQNQNTGDVESHGIEAQLEGTWVNGFQSRISYAWQETKNKLTNKRLTNSPEHMIKLNLIAPLWSEKIFIGFESQYMSQRKTPLESEVDDVFLSNLTLFTQDWVKGVEMSAGLYNLFDQKYFDPGSEEHTQNGIEQNGLTFRVKTSIQF